MLPDKDTSLGKDLERSRWEHHRFAVLYNRDDNAIGFTVTKQEADAICRKLTDLQWDMQKNVPADLPLVTFDDMITRSP
jgi:hypothetical protein